MEVTWTTLLIVCPLVFLSGLVDAVAGGGCGAVEDAKNSTSVPPSAGLVATIMNVCG